MVEFAVGPAVTEILNPPATEVGKTDVTAEPVRKAEAAAPVPPPPVKLMVGADV